MILAAMQVQYKLKSYSLCMTIYLFGQGILFVSKFSSSIIS